MLLQREDGSGRVRALRGQGDRRTAPSAFPLRGKTDGACVTGYPAKGATKKAVSADYEEKVMENGWKFEQFPDETRGSRDGLRYVVHYWSNLGATEVEVRVFSP